jgi:uncharacterized membrane protein
MSSFLVFVFSNAGGVDGMVAEMQLLQKQNYIAIVDAAAVTRKLNGRILVKQATDLVGPGDLGGPFWGMLISVLFYMPWLGLSVTTITQALLQKLSGFGISDSFVKETGATIRPGSSALFLIITSINVDKIIEVLSRHRATLLREDLSEEDEVKLREAFGAKNDEL